MGNPDYLLVFVKPGDNPNPVQHDNESFPVDQWQKWASPVWMDINQTNVLNGKTARDQADERHICPLQLDVIERALVMWSNPGDTVLSPFAGIGSEGYQSIKQGRKFIGTELKESYWKQAIDAQAIHESLFPFQVDVEEFLLSRGRAAAFLDTGLGKTIIQCEWARQVPGEVLIVAPLAVAFQTQKEAKDKLGMDITYSKDGTVTSKVTITNYERVENFDCSRFSGVVLDESSILKGINSKTKEMLCEKFKETPFRLACTATPAPNDYKELGNHAEFLGIMSTMPQTGG
jgi:hypothetical protein